MRDALKRLIFDIIFKPDHIIHIIKHSVKFGLLGLSILFLIIKNFNEFSRWLLSCFYKISRSNFLHSID